MSDDSNDAESMARIKAHVGPFLQASEHFAAGRVEAAFDVLDKRINAQPMADDDDELVRTWGMISVGAVLAGSTMRSYYGDPNPGAEMPEDDYWAVWADHPEFGSLDEALERSDADAVRVMIAGANHDHGVVSSIVTATDQQHHAQGMINLLCSLIALHTTFLEPS